MIFRDADSRLYKNRKYLSNMFSRYKKIYIYGAGKVAREYIALLNQENIKISGILVSENSKQTEIFGIPISVLKNDMNFIVDTLIIVAVGRKLQNEIKKKIKSVNLTCDIYYQQEFSIGDGGIDTKYYIEREYHKKVGTYFTENNELDKIGLKYNTDKCSYFHNYLHKYEFSYQSGRMMKSNFLN